MAQHLADEERVPGRSGVDGGGQGPAGVVEVVAGLGLHVGGHPGLVEPAQAEPVDAGLAQQVGQGVGQVGGDVESVSR